TCVLDHDGAAFFAGTYFPDQPRHGQPAFRQILEALSQAWTERPDEIARVAGSVRGHLERAFVPSGSDPVDAAVLEKAAQTLLGEYDARNGGFGTSPKFPPSMTLEHLRRYAARTGSSDVAGVVDHTLTAMARGGIYDQLAGGFARYSVDAHWVVPHFEKMLYDNAQLLGLYARWGTPLGDRVARETADFLLSELLTPQGGFASALDADSLDATGHSKEGAFYAWTPRELDAALGDDGPWAADLLRVTPAGTFEEGASTLQLLADPDDEARWADVRARLVETRSRRTRPALDDKVVAAWNGLAISGLVDAGTRLAVPSYVDAAVRCATYLWDTHWVDGRLRRVSRDGVVGAPAGVLEDYGCLATAYVDLAAATADHTWLDRARALLDVAVAHFAAGEGGWFDTADDAEALVSRPRDPGDNASPSGHSSLVHALLGYAALTGSGEHRDLAERSLSAVVEIARAAPRFAGWSLAAAEAALDGPVEVAVIGPDDDARAALAAAARRIPGALVVVAEPGTPGIPLLEARELVDGRAAAYVCRHLVCERPVTDPAAMSSVVPGGLS
ncbi:MAG: thioredoxin protein, partial [Nocardioidaceae bacterium]|nr:thioredoxin protein [Nocardioidaceae bacterium]